VRVAITRPAGSGATLARRVRALGGKPLSLPGFRLRAVDDANAARAALRAALACDAVVFTSPAAVRFARQLAALHTDASVFAPGRGTAAALKRAGARGALHPMQERSEGLLALPGLQGVCGRSVGIIGAAGGRGLLQNELAARGARIVPAYVYRRLPPRLDRRYVDALERDARSPLYVVLTSAGALGNILDILPRRVHARLLSGTAVVSSTRLADAARDAGFARVLRAASPHVGALLTVIAAERT
jgi:uroporphyrinogen-III synthase